MKAKKIMTYALLLLLAGCIEQFDLKEYDTQSFLVVEGVLSNQLKNHQIFLSRTTAINVKKVVREKSAVVTITNDAGDIISLSEKSPGVYETPLFAAEVDQAYTLHIKTSTGREYASLSVPFTNGPDIGNVYPSYIQNPHGSGKGIQVYVDTEDITNQGHYYRWNYIETYEVRAPFPSNWVWLGGTNLTFRIHGIDTCFATDTLHHIMLRSTRGQEADRISKLEMRYIDDTDYILRAKYSILVQQYCLSEQAYNYWNELRITSEDQGSLSDRQPGSLKGNMFSVSQPDEPVLGFFEVGKVSEKRIFFSAIDFYDQGLKMPRPLRESCFNNTPVSFPESELATQMPKYLQTMHIWEVAGQSPGVVVSLLPKSCCDCRDKGPNVRPDFF